MKADDLRITFDWENAASVKLPEHRATWARIEIRVGAELITLIEDRESGSSRRSIYGSLYPMAEWIAFNWWILKASSRQSSRFEGYRDREGLIASGQVDKRHSLRSAGDGFLWPNLLVLPEGTHTRLLWRRDRPWQANKTIRFLSQGERLVESSAVEYVLTSVVEAVLARLEEQGLPDTALANEWSAVQSSDEDETAFCLAAASLGLDPYAEAGEFEDEILRASRELDPSVVEDFFTAVTPSLITPGLDWILKAQHAAESLEPEREAGFIAALRREFTSEPVSHSDFPWKQGWHQARRVRAALGINESLKFNPAAYVRSTVRSNQDKRLHAFGRHGEDTQPVAVLNHTHRQATKRFILSRSLWHALNERTPSFLVTGAYTDRQKVERAFAAELLAPAAGIVSQLGDMSNITIDDIDQVADHFGVSPILVQRQIDNQLLAV